MQKYLKCPKIISENALSTDTDHSLINKCRGEVNAVKARVLMGPHLSSPSEIASPYDTPREFTV